MSRPRFSKEYRTFGEWLKAGGRSLEYDKEVIKKHRIYPDRNLKFLNSLKMSDIDLSLKPVSALTKDEYTKRGESLKVLNIMRKKNLLFQKVLKKQKSTVTTLRKKA